MTVIYNPALYIHCLISFLLLYWYTICYIERGVEMFESMEQVETFFEYRKAFCIKPVLDRITQLLQMHRLPQNQIEAIHIAGTNGKCSTLRYLSDALQANDYQVGVFASPSFLGLRGHILMNHTPITEEAFIRIFNEIYPAIQQLDKEQMHPTEFEIIT